MRYAVTKYQLNQDHYLQLNMLTSEIIHNINFQYGECLIKGLFDIKGLKNSLI